MAKTLVYNERLEGVLRQNNWRMILGGDWGDGIKFSQRMKYYDIFDPRARYGYEAITASPSMTVPVPGKAQAYIGKFEVLIFLKWAATAMALHSLKHPGAENRISIQLERDQLSFLLCVSDELQIWNRERPDSDKRRGSFKSINLEHIKAKENQIEASIKYVPYAGTNLSREIHQNPLIETINEDNLNLGKYLIPNPVTIDISSSIQGTDYELPSINLS